VELLPLKSGELAAALRNAGFSAFDFYGDFKYSIIRKIPLVGGESPVECKNMECKNKWGQNK